MLSLPSPIENIRRSNLTQRDREEGLPQCLYRWSDDQADPALGASAVRPAVANSRFDS
jgi:hypothetical protein